MRRVIEDAQQKSKVSLMRGCRLFGISRQSIYQARQRSQAKEQLLAPVESEVRKWRRRLPRVGTRKLYYMITPVLENEGIKLGRDGLFAYLKHKGLLIKPAKSYTKTTFSHHRFKKHPNLYKGISLVRPNQVYVSDITYVESAQGVHYLSLVSDAFSRKIVGYQLSRDMKASSVVKALKKTVVNRFDKSELIHHSDRGSQYCSDIYQQALKKYKMVPSTTDGYDCYQNALAERVNGILKQEFLIYKCNTFNQLKVLIKESVDAYNEIRPHLSLGMKTPNQVHKKTSCETQLAF